MHGLFCPIRLIHLIGRKSLHFEKTRMVTTILKHIWIFDCRYGRSDHVYSVQNRTRVQELPVVLGSLRTGCELY